MGQLITDFDSYGKETNLWGRRDFVNLAGFVSAAPCPSASTFFDRRRIGLNVVPGATQRLNEEILDHLLSLGVGRVRISLGDSREELGRALLFLPDLASRDFQIIAHLNLKPIAVSECSWPERWRSFLDRSLESISEHCEAVEVGTCVNRSRWSGYGAADLIRAVHWVKSRVSLPLLAPNLSDFEPISWFFHLALLRLAGCPPNRATVNLFVDRAGTPEESDIHVLGTRASRFVDLSLDGKIRWFARLARSCGVKEITSTYASWRLKGEEKLCKRRSVSEEEYAVLMSRYILLGISHPELASLFWGPLVSNSHGLLRGEYEKSSALFVAGATGLLSRVSQKRRPAFVALQNLLEFTRGYDSCQRWSSTDRALRLLRFDRSDQEAAPLFTAWRIDGYMEEPPFAAAPESRRDLAGRRVPASRKLGSSPEFFWFSRNDSAKLRLSRTLPETDSIRIRGSVLDREVREIGPRRWVLESDFLAAHPEFPRRNFLSRLEPLRTGSHTQLLRDSENRRSPLWVKKFRSEFLQNLRRESRGRRAWRAGLQATAWNIPTARVVALFEARRRPWRKSSGIIMEQIEGCRTIREVLKQGPAGAERKIFLIGLGRFLRRIHENGLFHRDLSGGNILVKVRSDGKVDFESLQFWVIDLDRSRFRRRVSALSRIRDLSRLALERSAARILIGTYLEKESRNLSAFWLFYRSAVRLYRLKRKIKKWLRGHWPRASQEGEF